MLEERLSGILRAGDARLRERMHLALRRGRLEDYLRSIGLSDELEEQTGWTLGNMFDSACKLLGQKIRHSRRKGYLKDYLCRIGMSDLLLSRRAREAAVGASLRGIVDSSAKERRRGLIAISGGGKSVRLSRPHLVLVG